VAKIATAVDFPDAARGAAAAQQPLRRAAGSQPRALGVARAGRRGQILTWTDDNLLRQVVCEGLREDKPAAEIRREVPHPKTSEAKSTSGRSGRPPP
jgi:hypothetical protein